MSEAGASIDPLLPGRSDQHVDLLSTAINAAVIAAVGILLGWFIKGRFDENDRRWEANERRWEDNERRWEANDRRWEGYERRLARIEARLETHDTRFDAIDGRMESFERSLDAIRSDMTRVALAVGTGPSEQAGAGP